QAHVEAVTAKHAQPRRQAMDLQVAFHRLLPASPGRTSCLVESLFKLGNRLREAPRDPREVPLVERNELGRTLCGEAIWKPECTADGRHDPRFSFTTGGLPQAPWSAIS